jgi:1-acyl-sn-glycerol-3-phosphate acyltransferase
MSQTIGRAIGASEPLVAPDATRPAPSQWQGTPGAAAPGPRHHTDRAAAERLLPRGDLGPFQRWFRNWFSRTVSKLIMKGWFRITVVNPERFLDGPGVYAFNHLSWMDPMLFLATLPKEPRLYFYGPKQEDLKKGKRNRFMWWTGVPVPFSPLKDDLITSVRYVQAVFDSGGALAIAPEGSIHVHEGDLLPFEDGAAYLALRAGVPIVPVAITGISAAFFRGRILVRIGEAIHVEGRPSKRNIDHYSAVVWHAIKGMIQDDRDLPRPSRFEAWLTDLFNDWGPGGREAATKLRGPDPAEVAIPPAAAPAIPDAAVGAPAVTPEAASSMAARMAAPASAVEGPEPAVAIVAPDVR